MVRTRMLDVAAPADKTRRVITDMNWKVKPRAVCRRRAQSICMMGTHGNRNQELPEGDLPYDADALRAS
jgi:hypothetical protein